MSTYNSVVLLINNENNVNNERTNKQTINNVNNEQTNKQTNTKDVQFATVIFFIEKQ